MAALRKFLVLAAFLVFALIAAVFAYGNRGLIDIDLGFARVEGVSMTVAFAAVFCLGALFGMGCLLLAWLKALTEKRILQRHLRSAEAEVSRLRSIPLEHAD